MQGPRFHLDHAFTRRHLSAHLDGELAPRDSRRIALHLAECADCRRAERSLGRLVSSLGWLRSGSSGALADGTIERVAAARRRGRRP